MEMLKRLSNVCPVVDKLKIIDEELSEVTLNLEGSNEFCNNGHASFECNPFEGQVWLVLEGIKYIDEIHDIRIELSQRQYDEDDIISVRW